MKQVSKLEHDIKQMDIERPMLKVKHGRKIIYVHALTFSNPMWCVQVLKNDGSIRISKWGYRYELSVFHYDVIEIINKECDKPNWR